MNTFNDYYGLVVELASLKHEGDFWDFKRQWHDNKVELLHDILCMANSPVDDDKYIIIGIDEENDYRPYDIKKDKNRRNTKQLNDILRARSFMGGLRPTVRVEEVNVNGNTIDIIVIENSNKTPFVLTEDWTSGPKGREKTISCGNIYTRIVDSNTPINKTAENDTVEMLWRRRFHIDKTPLEKVAFYLHNIDDWSSDENGENYYYKYAPEYTISMEFDQEEFEYDNDFLCKMYIDHRAHYSTAYVKVYGSVIKQFYYVGLDGFRFVTIRPQAHIITTGDYKKSLFLTYIDKDSTEYGLYNFIKHTQHQTDYQNYQRDQWFEHVIIFENEDERLQFIEYVKDNFDKIYEASKKQKSLKDAVKEPNSKSDWSECDEKDWAQTKALVEEYAIWKKDHKN